ncbi:hypothetical protein BDF21DRAFT_414721 [Thamnidium elegans]|uniref:Uncharacterized protein n=1 Tax=Thamnidium elegans TaxID=101142 RepID=A0A8H7SFU1_9FUNG|nr:hypothetical protein INT48_007028 [Thamnidium elegans]KAI8085231.1 hypothetical protein BDF21DRAFT_414721 [Thamnidium elegans]
MKLIILVTLAIALFCSLSNALLIPRLALSDQEVINLLITNETSSSNPGEIISPSNREIWYVGQHVNVTFSQEKPNETVSIFFFNQTGTLAGGPLTRTTFDFVVPPDAVSRPNESSLLIAVKRKNRYLQAVDAVIIKVLPAK